MDEINLQERGQEIYIKPTLTINDPERSTNLFDRQCSCHTLKGCPLEEDGISTWQKFVRLCVSSVLPAGEYQKRVSDVDQVDYAPRIVVAAGGKRVVQESGVEYEIDNYIEYYNCKPPTLFIPVITLAEVIIFIVYAVTEGGVTATEGAPLDSPLVYNPSRRYEAWRYLSYMLIHQGYVHLLTNIGVQMILGFPLEMVHKWWRVSIVYLLGVIAGSAVHSVFDRWTLLVGASGGVYALIGAHLAVIVMNWREMTHEWMGSIGRMISSAPVRLLLWGLFVAMDIGIALYTRYGTEEESKVGYAAHLGGALVGFLIGVPVLKNLDVQPWENVLWYMCLIAYIVIMIIVVVFNCFYPDYPTTDWRACCPDPIITDEKIATD